MIYVFGIHCQHAAGLLREQHPELSINSRGVVVVTPETRRDRLLGRRLRDDDEVIGQSRAVVRRLLDPAVPQLRRIPEGRDEWQHPVEVPMTAAPRPLNPTPYPSGFFWSPLRRRMAQLVRARAEAISAWHAEDNRLFVKSMPMLTTCRIRLRPYAIGGSSRRANVGRCEHGVVVFSGDEDVADQVLREGTL